MHPDQEPPSGASPTGGTGDPGRPAPGAPATGDLPAGPHDPSHVPDDAELLRLVEGRDAILAAVGHAATRFLRGQRWDDDIDDVLASLGEATGVDRVYLFTIRHVGDRTLSYQLSEWAAPGVESQLDLQMFQGFDMGAGGFQRWIDEMPGGHALSGRCAELPPSEGEVLLALGIEAIAVVPVEVGGRWWGWLAFEQTRHARDWSPVELDALEVAANVLGASIQRQELTDLLRENEARAETAYQREREASARLRALDGLKDTFLTAVSHELRTPLTAIRGFVATLLDHHAELDTARQLHILERLAVNVERLDGLLSELLDLNRLNQGVISAAPRETDIPALLLAAVGRTPGLQDVSGISTRTDVATAYIDPTLADRILDNLLRNAVRHTPAGSRIAVAADATPDGLLLSVDDDGPGIPAQHHATIFEPFTHGPNAASHAPGAGVGLSLVARFATLHGGRAWVEASPLGGARFCVLLADGRQLGPPDRPTDRGDAQGGGRDHA